jgi:predicted DNA-binding transcriptional regulator YafY
LKAYYPAANYIITKPIHASQKVSKFQEGENFRIIELDLVLNYEFETILLSYANECEILEPDDLRERIKKRAKEIISKNSSSVQHNCTDK